MFAPLEPRWYTSLRTVFFSLRTISTLFFRSERVFIIGSQAIGRRKSWGTWNEVEERKFWVFGFDNAELWYNERLTIFFILRKMLGRACRYCWIYSKSHFLEERAVSAFLEEESLSAFLDEGAVLRFWNEKPFLRFWRREPFLPLWREKGTVDRLQRKTLSPSFLSQ